MTSGNISSAKNCVEFFSFSQAFKSLVLLVSARITAED